LPIIIALVFGAIAVISAGWAILVRRTVRREAELLQVIRLRTAQLEEANEKLEALSYLDALTGIGNRRAFDKALDREWRRAVRSKQSLSLLMLDIDWFKSFNDRYGHQAGDKALVEVAAVLTDIIRRAGDTVARYGGEEFAVLMPETDLPGAAVIAGRILAGIQQMSMPAEDGIDGILTLSIGYAAIVPTDEGRSEALVAAADAALYQAKHDGRNRAVEAVLNAAMDAAELKA
jgi:diguanylate cyclase (GGDEF)-like protein